MKPSCSRSSNLLLGDRLGDIGIAAGEDMRERLRHHHVMRRGFALRHELIERHRERRLRPWARAATRVAGSGGV